MPPDLETSLFREQAPSYKHPQTQTRLVLGDGVISRSPDRGPIKVKSKIKPRTYPDGPLPFKPSQDAPREARIIGRVAELGKLPYFTLKVGDIEIDDVGLHEILEYVSPFELERFEHQQFEEEREALAAALAAAELEEERRAERRKERAKRKGLVEFVEIDENDADSADQNAASGRFGRARPTYKHLFKLPQERRRRRRRDPVTGELLPLSDDDLQEDNDIKLHTSEEGSPDPSKHPFASGELPKRRRRRRDPETGELLPLSPLPQDLVTRAAQPSPNLFHTPAQAPSIERQKRPRRRRHPVTGELMPLGWKYDPDTAEASQPARRDGVSPSMRKLSISQEQQVKRVKLASESSADESPPSRQASSRPNYDVPMRGTTTPGSKATIFSAKTEAVESHLRSPAPRTSMLRSIARTASSESSTEPVTLASFLKSSAAGQDDTDSDDSLGMPQKSAVRNTPTQGKTSIMHPIATNPPIDTNTSGDENKDATTSSLNEGEWFVEAIVGHKMSDPKSSPDKKPVQLYRTKWEGSNELTWEPADSFVDPDTVEAYRVRVGLQSGSATRRPGRVVPVVASSSNPKLNHTHTREDARASPNQHSRLSDVEASDDDMEDGYEIERILAHQMSDPRSHPGQPQTMLYKVKWAGFPESEATWEPRASFPDIAILNAYRRKVGLRAEE